MTTEPRSLAPLHLSKQLDFLFRHQHQWNINYPNNAVMRRRMARHFVPPWLQLQDDYSLQLKAAVVVKEEEPKQDKFHELPIEEVFEFLETSTQELFKQLLPHEECECGARQFTEEGLLLYYKLCSVIQLANIIGHRGILFDDPPPSEIGECGGGDDDDDDDGGPDPIVDDPSPMNLEPVER